MRTVLVLCDLFDLDRLARVERGLVVRAEDFGAIARPDVERGPTEELITRDAEVFFDLAIDDEEPALEILDVHRGARVVEHRLQQVAGDAWMILDGRRFVRVHEESEEVVGPVLVAPEHRAEPVRDAVRADDAERAFDLLGAPVRDLRDGEAHGDAVVGVDEVHPVESTAGDDLGCVSGHRLHVGGHVRDRGAVGRESGAHDRTRLDQALERLPRAMSGPSGQNRHSECGLEHKA